MGRINETEMGIGDIKSVALIRERRRGGGEVLSLRKLDSCKMYHTLNLQLVSYVTWTLLHLLKYLQLFAVKSNKDPQNLQKAFEKSLKK